MRGEWNKGRWVETEIYSAALSVVARIDHPESDIRMIRYLKDPHLAELRIIAVAGLSQKLDKIPNAVDLIIAQLEKEKDNNVKLACINALGESGKANALEAVKEFLKSGNMQLSQAAITAVARNSDKNNVGIVAELLDGWNKERRIMAAVALSKHIDTYPQLSVPVNTILAKADLNTRLAILSELGKNKGAVAAGMIKPFLKDPEPYIKEFAVDSLAKVTGDNIVPLVYPLIKDPNWRVRFSVVQAIGPKKLDRQSFESIKDLARKDFSPLVQSRALLAVSRFALSENGDVLTGALKSQNSLVRQAGVIGLAPKINEYPHLVANIKPLLNDKSWQVRLPVVEALSESKDPKIDQVIIPKLKDPAAFVRQAAVIGLAQVAKGDIVPFIKPLIKDPDWQVRFGALQAVDYKNYARIDRQLFESIKDLARRDINPAVQSKALLTISRFVLTETEDTFRNALKSDSYLVRQVATEILGVRVRNNPQLIAPLVDVLKYDSDPWARQLAAFSLRTVDPARVRPVQSLIQKDMPKVVVIMSGVDDFLGYMPSTKRYTGIDDTIWNNWRLRNILEAGGIKVIEYGWPGNLIGKSFREAQLGLDKTINTALNISQGGKIGIIPYSGGNRVNERITESDLDPNIKQAIREQRIRILSLGSPSKVNFSTVDNNWKNIVSPADWISMISAISVPGKHNVEFRNISHRNVFNEQQVISYIGYNMFGWKYTPYSGSWPGKYDFTSLAPPDYYRQASDINIAPPIGHMQQFRAPADYYLHQGQVPFQAAPRFEQPKWQNTGSQPGVDYRQPSIPMYTPPQQYNPPPMQMTPPPQPYIPPMQNYGK